MRRSRIAAVTPVVVAALFAAGAARAVPPAGPTAPRLDSIRAADMMADLRFLCSDRLKGREAGTVEDRIAAEFIAARFRRLGCVPLLGSSFLDDFAMTGASLGAVNRLDVASEPARSLACETGQDFYPQRFSGSGRARGEAVFVGYGLRPEDYGPAVKGRIALALNHEPGENDPDSPYDGLVSSEASFAHRKAILAQSQGAAGILFVLDARNHPGPQDFAAEARAVWPSDGGPGRLLLSAWTDRIFLPAGQVSVRVAEEIVRPSGRTFADLGLSAESPSFRAVPLPGPALELTTSVLRRTVRGANVLAVWPGADPNLRGEYVIVCAHHDHLGESPEGIFPGADDAISGVAAAIDIAEAFALAGADGVRPPRSILFASWDAEEKLLFGAWSFVERPAVPLDRIAGVLNMDMIGRNEEVPATWTDGRFRGIPPQTAESNTDTVNVLGLSRWPGFRAVLDRADAAAGLTFKTILDNHVSQLLRRSDHWPFVQRGVPAVWFLTGMHPDYHTTNDTPDRVVPDKMERIARLTYEAAWILAREGRPARK